MTEPTYSYVKGVGWVVDIYNPLMDYSNYPLTVIYGMTYPDIVKDKSLYQILNKVDFPELRVGDIIPYMRNYSVIQKIEILTDETMNLTHKYYPELNVYESGYYKNDYYTCVARRLTNA